MYLLIHVFSSVALPIYTRDILKTADVGQGISRDPEVELRSHFATWYTTNKRLYHTDT